MIGLAEWFKGQPCRFIFKTPALKKGIYEASITDVEVYDVEIVINLGELRPVPELEDK